MSGLRRSGLRTALARRLSVPSGPPPSSLPSLHLLDRPDGELAPVVLHSWWWPHIEDEAHAGDLPLDSERNRPAIMQSICGLAIELELDLPPAAETPAYESPDADIPPETIQAVGKKGKRTYQPNRLKRKRTHGFLKRMSTKAGRKVIKRRIKKGRWRVSVT